MSIADASRKRGFTLIELLVVISIIGLLVGLLLPQLAKARERARYIRWKGYSHGLRANPEMSAYYNMEEQQGDETKRNDLGTSTSWTHIASITNLPTQLGVVYNRAAGDPFEQAKGRNSRRSNTSTTVEPGLRDLYLLPAEGGSYATNAITNNRLPQWTQRNGRWLGKGALNFGSNAAHIPTGFDGAGKGRDSFAVSQNWDGLVGDTDRTFAFWARGFDISVTGIGDWGLNDPSATIATRFSVRTNNATGAGMGYVPQVTTDATDIRANPANNDTRANVRDGKWHWVVITANRNQVGDGNLRVQDLRCYVDGRDFGNNQAASTSTIDSRVNQFVLGNDLSGAICWNGTIDEVQIWRTALTADKNDGTGTTVGGLTGIGALITAGSIWDNWQAGAPESRR